MSRVTGASLPAGLAGGEGGGPDMSRIRLEPGDWVVLLTDGVMGGGSDQWLRDALAAYQGDSPRELAQAILEGGPEQGEAADDRTVLALWVAAR